MMILGMTTAVFIHVVLSLIGLVSGFVAVFGLLSSKRLDGWTALFLATTVLTSVTGFFLPAEKLLPSHIVGIISLVVLAVAILARYAYHLAGAWRWIYVIGAVIGLYLNFFVFIVQSFLKVPALKALAPTGSEPPFLVAQVIALVLFVVLGIGSVRGFKGPAVGTA
jgi:hypothetical protein